MSFAVSLLLVAGLVLCALGIREASADESYNAGEFQPLLDWSLVQAGRIDFVGEGADRKPKSTYVPYGVKLSPQTATRSKVWMKSDRIWEADRINGYTTVILENGTYKLWYEALGDIYPKKGSVEYCYAESADGFTWSKPDLGIVEYNGDTINNISFHHAGGGESGSVFVDPSAAPEERYKRIYLIREDNSWNLIGAVSADGLRWTELPEPVLKNFFSDTQMTAYYDSAAKQYVGYFRGHRAGRRAISRAVTTDFASWPVPQVILTTGINDHPAHDLYTNSHSRYPGLDNLHLMFPAQYNHETDRVEIHIATSNNGVDWEYYGSKPVLGVSGTPYNTLYCGYGIVPLGNDRYGVPCCGLKATHNDYTPLQKEGEYFWAMWKRDRFVAVEATKTGYFALSPWTVSSDTLYLNASTKATGAIKVQLSDGAGNALKGYSFSDCDPINGDYIKKAVTWKGISDLSAINGRSVVVEIKMNQAKVFAFRL